jgi:RNA polymerase sigma factor (sigma-70 family)
MPVPSLQKVDDARPDAIVRAARTGDNNAWARLLPRYDRLVRTIARSYRLQPSDVDDVVQMTWMRLYRNIDRVRDPAAIAGWLTTTARREAMRVLRTHVREELSDDPELGDVAESDRLEANVLAAEDRLVLGQAIAVLPGRQRELMNLLATQPDPDYEYISASLEMPMGSIGPTRARGLMRLRRDRKLHMHHHDTA